MKNTIIKTHWPLIPALCCTLAGMAIFEKSARCAPPTGTSWGLIYADEFGGNSVDTQKWITQYPWGPTHNASNSAYMLPQNLSVANGVLTETGKRETAPDGKAFTSGVISTGGIFNYTYGYTEARIKLPSMPGSFPAFWGLYTGWPPEIDIMEFPVFPAGDTLMDYYAAYHYSTPSGNGSNGAFESPSLPAGQNLTSDWHTYGMEWTSSDIKFYFDGVERASRRFTDDAEIADMVNMYLILNYSVGGGTNNWPTVPDTTQWPVGATATTQVDWVRVWKGTSSYPATTVWTNPAGGSWDTSSNWSAGSPQINTQTATFGSVAAANVSVDWTNSRTVGRLLFNSSVNYTLGTGNDSIMLTSSNPITSEQPNSNSVVIDATSATGASPNIINSRLELYNNVVIRSPNKPMTINGPITGLGSLRIDSGQITLNNAATYAGSTNITGGTLKLGASPVAVAHRWSFNNSLTDSVGGSTALIVNVGGNDVTLSSTQATLAGGVRDSSDYIHLGSNLLPDANSPIAIELWATPRYIQNWSRIFDFGSGTSENLLMSWTQSTNQISDRVEWKDAVTNTSDNTNQPYNLNTEYHIVMLFKPLGSSTEVTWYSALSGSADLGPAKGSFITSNSLASFVDTEDNLGRSSYSGDNTANASYNEVRFWTGPINSTILETLHDAGPDANINSLNVGLAGGLLPSTTAVNLSGSTATLDLNGITQTIASLAGVAGSSVLLGGGRLTLGGNGTSTTFSGSISGAGDIIKTGNGTFVLDGANSHSGSTYVTAGILEIKNATALGNTTAGTIVQNGASLLISQSLSIGNESLSITGTGAGSGALHISPSVTVTYAGAINLADNASIQVDANSTLDMTNPLGISGLNKDLTFITDTGSTAALRGNLDIGNGDLTKNGGGELHLDQDLVSLATLTVTGGIVKVGRLHVDLLNVASGAKLVICPVFLDPLSGFVQPVPEPSTILLLILAAAITLVYSYKK